MEKTIDIKIYEKLKRDNQILKQALSDQIDYHHFVGNDDCPIKNNEKFVTLYNLASDALKNLSK